MSTLLITGGLLWLGFAIVSIAMEVRERRLEHTALRIVKLAAWRVALHAGATDIETRHRETVTRAVQLGRIDGMDIAHMLGGKTQLDAAAWWAIGESND